MNQERAVSVQAAIAGMKGSDGRPIEVIDVDKEMKLFDQRLHRPLNHDRMREALLKEVSL